MGTRTLTLTETVASPLPARLPPNQELARNLASAALAMSTSMCSVATAAALVTAQQRALADAYAAPRGALESLCGPLADEVLRWCGLRTLGRAACCSRLLREHCYAPHLYGAAKVGLALQRRFPRPRTLGEARFLCAPEPRKGGPRAPRAPGDAVRAPLASFVLGCTGSSVVEDEDDFEGFAANRAWLDAKRRYRAHVVRSQRCLRALRDTGRLPPGIEVCYVSSVHDGAFVSRVSATRRACEPPPAGPAPRRRAAPPERALVHLSCGHSSWRVAGERGATPSRQAAGNIRAAVDIEASALRSRDLRSLVCEHLVCDARLPTLRELSVVALHAVRNSDAPVDVAAQIQLVALLGCDGLRSLQLRAPRAIAFPPDANADGAYLDDVDVAAAFAVAKRHFPDLARFSVVVADGRGGQTTKSAVA